MAEASDKQIDYILTLWNRLHGGSAKFLSQTDIPMSQRERRGGMTKVEASGHIDALLEELKGS